MPPTVAKESPPATKPLRLLLVDDNENDVAICIRELKKGGLEFQADSVNTREDFLQRLRDHAYDVVLADYRLPGWTGMEALEQIKQLGLDIPVILVTGTLGDDLAVECIKQGVTDYVLKEHLARLPLAIRRAQEQRRLRGAEALAVEALRESEARYRGLVHNATYGILWALVPDGELLYVNPALVHMLGYESPEELIQIKFTKGFYCDPSEWEKSDAEFAKKGRLDTTFEWKRKDAKVITVRVNGRHVVDPERKAECIEEIVEDVTERLALEKKLQQAQKFESIGQLAGGIAHDFNNMIGAILGWADLGMEETEAESRVHRHFEKVRHQADRAAALTRQLLAFARRQILEPRNMDLNLTVTETLSLLEKVFGSNIEIKATLASDLAVVRADPTQVEQVLMNLCINARDAMPNGGAMVIETKNMTLDDKYCTFHPLARPGHYAMLCVSDTGIGMDAVTLDRIFEPFYTTKEQGKGTGLGLATVYGVVRQHGGFVHVYSEPGIGSTFRVYFPASAQVADAQNRAEDSRPVRGGAETVLVAEDHEGLREIAREILTSLGYQVVLAADGEQAVREFQANPARIDLLLLDVVLPKLSGLEAYGRICEVKPGVPVIFATGYGADIALRDKVHQQGLPVLQKPYTARDLARKVREALDRRSALVPNN
jgi:two-component system, cell cycle sensor histidine kinase and response regulator CckA